MVTKDQDFELIDLARFVYYRCPNQLEGQQLLCMTLLATVVSKNALTMVTCLET